MILKCIRTMLAAIALGFAALGAVAAGSTAHAAKPETYTAFASTVAVGGYDPVAYFTAGAPTKGVAAHATTYKGAEYRFANAENLAAFKANPAKYAPQYGGYCAWATAQGYTAPGRPTFWKIVDGRLFLNYDGGVQAKWEKDIPGFIKKADANWPTVLQK